MISSLDICVCLRMLNGVKALMAVVWVLLLTSRRERKDTIMPWRRPVRVMCWVLQKDRSCLSWMFGTSRMRKLDEASGLFRVTPSTCTGGLLRVSEGFVGRGTGL